MPKITDEMWKCPECSAGFDNGDGLCGDEYTTYEEALAAEETDETPGEYGECNCMNCGWTGTPQDVYDSAQKQAGRVPCACCKGTGWVDGKKAE